MFFKYKYIIIFGLLLTTFGLVSCTPSNRYLLRNRLNGTVDNRYIRVLILKSKNRITVATHDKLKISVKRNRKVIYESKNKRITLSPEKVRRPLIIESWNSPLIINNKPYRGVIELQNILGSIHVINVLKLNEYLYSVVPSEIPSSWEHEALKAQAIAARTYAFYHINHQKSRRLYDLNGTTRFQVYKGLSVENPATTEAVNRTAGELIVFKNEPIISYFHSTCGGKTIDDKYIWKRSDFPYLKGTSCAYCQESPHYNWDLLVSLNSIRSALKKDRKQVGRIKSIIFKKRNDRIIDVSIKHTNGTINLTGNNFRLLLKANKIKSMYFKSKKYQKGLMLKGKGWGHGVGMCQWGARGLAKKGASYKKILRHYYNNIHILRIKNRRFAKKYSE